MTLRIIGAFLRRNALIETSYRMQLALTLCGILASITTFYFVAQLVDRHVLPLRAAYGSDYFAFVLVGLACAQYSSVAMYGLAGHLRQEQMQGTLETMLAHPVRLRDVVVGLPAWEFCWATMQLVLYVCLGVALFHCDLSRANWTAAALVLVASLMVFFALGLISAACVLFFKRGNPIQWVLNTAFTLLGGVYFPVTLLPTPLATVAQALPITHVLHGLRRALLAGESLTAMMTSLGAILAFGLVLLPLGAWSLVTALRHARRRGSLLTY